MGWFAVTLVVCILQLSAVLGGLSPQAGSYDIKISKFDDCEDEGTGQVFITSRISSAGRGKYLYNSPLNLGVPIDNKFKTDIEIQRLGNGRYRPRTFFSYVSKNCEDLWKNAKDFLTSLITSAGYTLESCPVPARNYTPNFIIDVEVDSCPALPYDKYKIIANYIYENKKVGCHIVYGEVVPKKTKCRRTTTKSNVNKAYQNIQTKSVE